MSRFAQFLNESEKEMDAVAKRFGYTKKKGTNVYHHEQGHQLTIEKDRWTHHRAGGGVQVGHSEHTLVNYLDTVHKND